jgi:hypothetical protein
MIGTEILRNINYGTQIGTERCTQQLIQWIILTTAERLLAGVSSNMGAMRTHYMKV